MDNETSNYKFQQVGSPQFGSCVYTCIIIDLATENWFLLIFKNFFCYYIYGIAYD